MILLLAALLGLARCGFAATVVGSVTLSGADQSSGSVWDAGTVTATFNGVSVSTPYGEFSTPASVASALGALISQNCNMPVYAEASGATLTLYQKGSNVITSSVIASESRSPSLFSSNSFPVNGGSVWSLGGVFSFGPRLGWLTYNAATVPNTCQVTWNSSYPVSYQYNTAYWSNIEYVPDPSTGSASIPIGGLEYINGSLGPGQGTSDSCPANGPVNESTITYTDTSSTDGGIQQGNTVQGYTISVNDVGGGLDAAFSLSGYINPKWELLGILYAPAGAQNSGGNNVNYTNSTLLSVTNSIDKTWSSENTVSTSFSEKAGVNLPGVWKGNLTFTEGTSNSWTQGTEDDTSTTVSKTTNLGLSVKAGPSGYAGLDHDWDVLEIWLNPVTLVTLGNGGVTSWSGYGFNSGDSSAPNDMDVDRVNLGCLNGHWNASSFPSGLGPSDLAQAVQQYCGSQTYGYTNPTTGQWTNGPFLRTWAQTQTFDSPDTPPSPQPTNYNNASLSPADFQAISQMDPWYNCTNESPQPSGDEDWTEACPSPNPEDSAETNFQALQAEFTPISTNGPVPYQQGENFSGTIGYQDLDSQSTTSGTTSTRSFGWEVGMEYSNIGEFYIFSGGITASVKYTGKETSTINSNNEITNQTTSTVSATLGPPPNQGVDGCPSNVLYPPGIAYTNYPDQSPDCGVPIPELGPAWGQQTSFNVYEDNYFGSFLFSPVYY